MISAFFIILMSTDPSFGLEAWEARRKQWTTPSPDFDIEKYIQELDIKEYRDLADSKKRVGIYKQLIQQLQTFTHPVPLRFIVKTDSYKKEAKLIVSL